MAPEAWARTARHGQILRRIPLTDRQEEVGSGTRTEAMRRVVALGPWDCFTDGPYCGTHYVTGMVVSIWLHERDRIGSTDLRRLTDISAQQAAEACRRVHGTSYVTI